MASKVKLNLGCGSATSENWTNIDRSLNIYLSRMPRIKTLLYRIGVISEMAFRAKWTGKIVRRDVTKGIPFASDSVDFIYSSHMLEHLGKDETIALLAECVRVLKKGGVLRVTVPDLKAMVHNYMSRRNVNPGNDITPAEQFLNDLYMYFPEGATYFERVFGKGVYHKWMYDEESLSTQLRKAGFSSIEVWSFRNGRTPDLDVMETKSEDCIFLEAVK